MTETKIASEAGHWYDARNGQPVYTVIGKNGKERATTLRDARDPKRPLVPSVTTICAVLAKPALTKWLQKQVLDAALTLPRKPDENETQYAERVIEDAAEQSRKAREAGTKLHAVIESWLAAPYGLVTEYSGHLKNINHAVAEYGIGLRDGKAERSFSHPDGFGGKVDWHDDSTVVDFKTKERIEDKRLAYDEHVMQLAAYAHGLNIEAPRCLNVFVGVKDGNVVVHEWNTVEIAKGLRLFKHALAIWQEKNDWRFNESVEDSITRQTGGQL